MKLTRHAIEKWNASWGDRGGVVGGDDKPKKKNRGGGGEVKHIERN